MADELFDEHAEAYDTWFMQNRMVLGSELLLFVRAVGQPGVALSVGCGSGLFESLALARHGMAVTFGVDPSPGMATIARKRGLSVALATAEALPYLDETFDTVVFNGSPSYIADLERAFRNGFAVLRPGGQIVVLDVPAESSYGLLYRLAAAVGRWGDWRVSGAAPEHPYPLALATGANWRTTPDKVKLLETVGFVDLTYYQTLTRHPRYSNHGVEEVSEGYDRGDYVAIRARRPNPHAGRRGPAGRTIR